MDNNNPVHESANATPVFHLGITMAGAASAGCYTAGAMDYLFEILNLWEEAKQGKLPPGWENIEPYIPQHKVMIDAMGGTSAGGMTTVMSAIYALKGKVKPVSQPDTTLAPKDNVLYDSWVLMGEREGKPSLMERVFDTADLQQSGKLESLLNSDFIDAICDDAFTDDKTDKKPLPFVSNDLELVLSHTMLRSIPLTMDFGTPLSRRQRTSETPTYSSREHFTVSHFKRDYDAANPAHANKYLPLDPYGAGAAAMKLATIATGAFPVGLRFREFFANELSAAYLQQTANSITFDRLSGQSSVPAPQIKWPDNFPNPYKFVSIDGGAVNNEPFGEVMSILKNRYGNPMEDGYYKYGMVMIDPFPDWPGGKTYNQPADLFGVVPAIIGTLWDQSKVKRAEMLDAYSTDYCRGQLYPLKWQTRADKERYPIACGAAMAFSGFLDVDFRKHDFFLGRNNARNFYRALFCLEYHRDEINPANNIIHPIHKDWTPEMVKLFGRVIDDKTYLPVVPDLYYLKNKLDGKPNDPYQYDFPQKPTYDPARLVALSPNMTKRVEKMLELTLAKAAPGVASAMDKLVTSKRDGNWWKRFTQKLGNKVLHLVFILVKRRVARRIAGKAIAWVLDSLDKQDLLKK